MAVKPGFIYVLTHPSDPFLVKVGMTTRTPEERLQEHNKQFDKAAGKIVKETGKEWILKEYFPVEDTYNAESAFYRRSPLTEIPFRGKEEILRLSNKFLDWEWVEVGLAAAKAAGIRNDRSQPPIPKPKPKRGAVWIEEQIKGSGLRPLKGAGNGITKAAFECPKGHVFKISGRLLVKTPHCPICEPEKFDAYTLNHIE